MKRRTKIVCTLGPAVATKQKIKDLIEAGMNVVRINCSHGDWETRHQWIEWIRELSDPVNPLAILVDLQGPKFRIGPVPGGKIVLTTGQSISVGQSEEFTLNVLSDVIYEVMKPGDRILIGDGEVEIKLGAKDHFFQAKVTSGGPVKTRQGITIVGRSFDVPALTEQDMEDIFEACKAGVEFIALSYVRRAADLRELRRQVDKFDKEIKLCAKIETKEALKDIDEILKVSDVIMVARGDLGLQMNIEDVPVAQKRIIRSCSEAGVPVITATQMLESMIQFARPTRAEATDVANAILDGTDAVMLSGETAAGQYPIEAVKMMARIAEKAEPLFNYEARLSEFESTAPTVTEGVAHAAARLAADLKVKAILTTTTSGQTARMVSKFRPRVPILCASWNERTQRQMAIVWGVESIHICSPETTDDIVAHAMNAFLTKKRLKVGDWVVVTAGVPAGRPGNTNLILVQHVH